MRGPIDFIIVGFRDNKFTGNILSELEKATKDGTIAVLALTVIAKDKDGSVTMLDVTDEGDVAIVSALKIDNSLVGEDDVQEVGDLLETNTAAGLLIVEHLWAKGLKKAIADAGGELIADGRIHPDASAELNDKEGK